MGYSPWGHQESDMTEQLSTHKETYTNMHTLLKKKKSRLPGGSDGKASDYNAGDPGSIPGLGRFSREGNGNPLQYSCLENPMDRGAW